MKTHTSRSEKIVCVFAVAVLLVGFATGVIAQPNHTRPHAELHNMHFLSAQDWRNE